MNNKNNNIINNIEYITTIVTTIEFSGHYTNNNTAINKQRIE